MRCFCDQREQNMGEGRAEPSPEPHTLCYTPRRPKGGERSGARLKGASSKNIFHSISF